MNAALIVQLGPGCADALQLGHRQAAVTPLVAMLDRFGAVIRPQHPGSIDPLLRKYFVVSCRGEHAEQLAAMLVGLDVVEAAYVQPSPMLP